MSQLFALHKLPRTDKLDYSLDVCCWKSYLFACRMQHTWHSDTPPAETNEKCTTNACKYYFYCKWLWYPNCLTGVPNSMAQCNTDDRQIGNFEETSRSQSSRLWANVQSTSLCTKHTAYNCDIWLSSISRRLMLYVATNLKLFIMINISCLRIDHCDVKLSDMRVCMRDEKKRNGGAHKKMQLAQTHHNYIIHHT